MSILAEEPKAYTLGAQDYLVKPVERARLLEVLERHSAVDGTRNVLLVEDDAIVRALIERKLLRDGWNGQINQEVTVTFEAPGVYGYQCTPHASVGMFGLVVCQAEDGSAPANLEAAQSVRQRGRASQVWDAIWAEAGEMGLLG